MLKLELFLWLIQLLIVGVVHRSASQIERSPWLACRVIEDEDECTQESFCCFDKASKTCFSPSLDDDFECAAIFDKPACDVWMNDCRWDDDQRRCVRLPLDKASRCPVAWQAKQKQAQKDNTYCWGKRKEKPCVFPFTYMGQTFTKCASTQEYNPPLPGKEDVDFSAIASDQKGGGGTWCAIKDGPITKGGDWDFCECTESKRKKSVLFIILDDLRPEFPVYGRYTAKIPNIEELARRAGSVVVEKAYTMFPLCAPSRASFLSGLTPEFTRVVDSYARGLSTRPGFRSTIKTIPQVFRENGYYSAGGGKVFHLHHDDDLSWNLYYFLNLDQNRKACTADQMKLKKSSSYFVETKFACETDAPEESLLDFRLGASAIKALETIVMKKQEPFFFALGIFKPHTPHHAQRKYWELYPNNGIDDAERLSGPTPQDSYRQFMTFDMDSELISPLWKEDTDEQHRYRNTLRTGYVAALSQSDAVIGKVLEKLSELKLTDSTMIVLIGDNGIALGENGMFGKDTNFDIAARVPVIFHIPWLAQSNKKKDAVARFGDMFSLTDLMTTMTSMMNVPLDPRFPYHGVNHSPRLALLASGRNLNNVDIPPARTMAFSQIFRCTVQPICTFTPFEEMSYVGYSIRTAEWRYSVYLKLKRGVVQWNEGIVSEELYSHSDDYKTLLNYEKGADFQVEVVNLAPQNPEICAQMFELIKQRFKVKYTVGIDLLA